MRRRPLAPDAGAVTGRTPFPARPTFAGAAHTVDLSAEFTAELRRFIEQEKASPVVVLLAALSVLWLPSCLRLVIIGGERALPDRLLMWRRLNVPLMNCYGLTETTVTSAFFRLDPADLALPSYRGDLA